MSEHRHEPDRPAEGSGHSWGNMSDAHWSRARKDKNTEALEYYRKRSKAPGVAEGGESRNFYCMTCDGVIPHGFRGQHCPHCKAAIDERVKRYFNWVEINEPPSSDFKALIPIAVGSLTVIVVVALVIWRWWAWS